MTNVNKRVRSLDESDQDEVLPAEENTLACLRETVERSEGIPRERLLFLGGPRVVDDANEGDIIESNATYQLWVKGGLGGGKGGFGTLLRSTGKKKGRNNAEPNNDLCRDLKGQRYHVSENARKNGAMDERGKFTRGRVFGAEIHRRANGREGEEESEDGKRGGTVQEGFGGSEGEDGRGD